MNSKIHYINNAILRMAREVPYYVADAAPGTFADLAACGSHLVIWAGASDRTIYGDSAVNHAFRAWHDAMHLRHGLLFTVEHEIELGRIQAAQCSSALVADLVYYEVAGQSEHYRLTGEFVADQVAFTDSRLHIF